jgi:hypothetical protein
MKVNGSKIEWETRSITKTEACEILGITLRQFTKLESSCQKTAENLYDRSYIEHIEDSDIVKAFRKKRKGPFNHSDYFDRNYGDPFKYLLQGAFAMYKLNKYCKTISPINPEFDEIQSLKTRYIQFLYSSGFCKCVSLNSFETTQTLACDCVIQDNENVIRKCNNCHGKGHITTKHYKEHFTFDFKFKWFTCRWNIPKDKINFKINYFGKPLDHITSIPLYEIPRRDDRSHSKALLKWIIKSA